MESSKIAMSEKVRNLDVTTASMNPVSLNNLVVSFRPVVRKCKVDVVNKLVKQIRLWRNMKGTEEQKAANNRKAERYRQEILTLKKLNTDMIAKYSLANTTTMADMGKQADAEGRILLRLASHKPMVLKVESWRQKHDDWKSLAAYLFSKTLGGRRYKKSKTTPDVEEKGNKKMKQKTRKRDKPKPWEKKDPLIEKTDEKSGNLQGKASDSIKSETTVKDENVDNSSEMDSEDESNHELSERLSLAQLSSTADVPDSQSKQRTKDGTSSNTNIKPQTVNIKNVKKSEPSSHQDVPDKHKCGLETSSDEDEDTNSKEDEDDTSASESHTMSDSSSDSEPDLIPTVPKAKKTNSQLVEKSINKYEKPSKLKTTVENISKTKQSPEKNKDKVEPPRGKKQKSDKTEPMLKKPNTKSDNKKQDTEMVVHELALDNLAEQSSDQLTIDTSQEKDIQFLFKPPQPLVSSDLSSNIPANQAKTKTINSRKNDSFFCGGSSAANTDSGNETDSSESEDHQSLSDADKTPSGHGKWDSTFVGSLAGKITKKNDRSHGNKKIQGKPPYKQSAGGRREPYRQGKPPYKHSAGGRREPYSHKNEGQSSRDNRNRPREDTQFKNKGKHSIHGNKGVGYQGNRGTQSYGSSDKGKYNRDQKAPFVKSKNWDSRPQMAPPVKHHQPEKRKGSNEVLHPSWAASKKRKQQQTLTFQGKKTTFSDDD